MWGIDFISEIANKSSGGHKWILVATDYFTKWIEVITTRQATSKVVIKFLLENILTRFGVPRKIVVDNGMCFKSNEFFIFVKIMASLCHIHHLIIPREMDRQNPAIKTC